MPEKQHTPDENLQQEFNRWAEAGEGEKMENHHLNITEKTLRQMNLRPGERVLDLGCGSGWATRLLAAPVAAGARRSRGKIICSTKCFPSSPSITIRIRIAPLPNCFA